MAYSTGALLTSDSATYYVIVSPNKRQFPDLGTLNALTLGLAKQLSVTVPAAVLTAIPAGDPFVSVQAFAAANPRIQKLITNAVRGIIPKTGLKDLVGGMATVAIAAAALYANAISDPTQWVQPINGASHANPVTQTVQKLITDTFNKLLNQAIQQMGGEPSDDSDTDDAVDDTVDAVNNDKDQKDDKEQDKEDVKEAGDKEVGDKETGDKETDKEQDKEDKESKEDQEKTEEEKTEKEDTEKTEKEDTEKSEKEEAEKIEKEEKETKDAEKEEKDGDDDDDDDDDDDGGAEEAVAPHKTLKDKALEEWKKIIE